MTPTPEQREIPDRILVVPDDYHTEYVGVAEDGRLFFLTTPFEPMRDEYVAVFFWNPDGSFESLVVDNLGPRGSYTHEYAVSVLEKRKHELGEYRLEEIQVAPFAETVDGVEFGLVPFTADADDPDDISWVKLMPGDFVAYAWPWDGEYDT
jgi:hypothetical protein